MFSRESPRFREFQFTLNILRRSKLNLVSLGIIIGFYLMSFFAPWISPHDPVKVDLTQKLVNPNSVYFIGTDELGRDIASPYDTRKILGL